MFVNGLWITLVSPFAHRVLRSLLRGSSRTGSSTSALFWARYLFVSGPLLRTGAAHTILPHWMPGAHTLPELWPLNESLGRVKLPQGNCPWWRTAALTEIQLGTTQKCIIPSAFKPVLRLASFDYIAFVQDTTALQATGSDLNPPVTPTQVTIPPNTSLPNPAPPPQYHFLPRLCLPPTPSD